MQSIGKYLIVFGLIIAFIGAILTFFSRLNFFGKLPGDISFKGENYSIYFPIVTSIVLSIVLTVIFWLINYFMRK